jgi:hypothetical protein
VCGGEGGGGGGSRVLVSELEVEILADLFQDGGADLFKVDDPLFSLHKIACTHKFSGAIFWRFWLAELRCAVLCFRMHAAFTSLRLQPQSMLNPCSSYQQNPIVACPAGSCLCTHSPPVIFKQNIHLNCFIIILQYYAIFSPFFVMILSDCFVLLLIFCVCGHGHLILVFIIWFWFNFYYF